MDIGNLIKKLRKERGLSQEELGALLGVQRAAVQKWECGTVKNLKREKSSALSALDRYSGYTGCIPSVHERRPD